MRFKLRAILVGAYGEGLKNPEEILTRVITQIENLAPETISDIGNFLHWVNKSPTNRYLKTGNFFSRWDKYQIQKHNKMVKESKKSYPDIITPFIQQFKFIDKIEDLILEVLLNEDSCEPLAELYSTLHEDLDIDEYDNAKEVEKEADRAIKILFESDLKIPQRVLRIKE